MVLGAGDMSASLGMLGKIDRPRVLDALQTIIPKDRGAGLFVGAGLGPDSDCACLMAERVDQTFSSIRTRLGETTQAEQRS